MKRKNNVAIIQKYASLTIYVFLTILYLPLLITALESYPSRGRAHRFLVQCFMIHTRENSKI